MEPVVGAGPGTRVANGEGRGSEGPVTSVEAGTSADHIELDEVQAAVFDLLRSREGGLTARQIQAHLSCSAQETAAAVEALLARGFITRLNTLVPSYGCRAETRGRQ